VHNRYSRTVEK